jgi:hypothetical protein
MHVALAAASASAMVVMVAAIQQTGQQSARAGARGIIHCSKFVKLLIIRLPRPVYCRHKRSSSAAPTVVNVRCSSEQAR